MTISSVGPTLPESAVARDPVVRTEVPGSAINKTQEASAPQTRPPEESHRAQGPSDAIARDEAEMREVVEIANERLKSTNAVIAFDVDPETKMVVTTLLDSRTNEVIRQIPTEAVLEIARSLDKIAPILVQEKV